MNPYLFVQLGVATAVAATLTPLGLLTALGAVSVLGLRHLARRRLRDGSAAPGAGVLPAAQRRYLLHAPGQPRHRLAA